MASLKRPPKSTVGSWKLEVGTVGSRKKKLPLIITIDRKSNIEVNYFESEILCAVRWAGNCNGGIE